MKPQHTKRQEAEARQAAHSKRSAQEQLALVAARRGESRRESAKLQAK